SDCDIARPFTYPIVAQFGDRDARASGLTQSRITGVSVDPTACLVLKRLLETPSPSGFEQAIQQVVREWAGGFADEVRTDTHGNVFASRFPEGRPADAPRVLLAGHCDQIRLMVAHIDAEGLLYIQS